VNEGMRNSDGTYQCTPMFRRCSLELVGWEKPQPQGTRALRRTVVRLQFMCVLLGVAPDASDMADGRAISTKDTKVHEGNLSGCRFICGLFRGWHET